MNRDDSPRFGTTRTVCPWPVLFWSCLVSLPVFVLIHFGEAAFSILVGLANIWQAAMSRSQLQVSVVKTRG